jgi:hypothetical protein
MKSFCKLGIAAAVVAATVPAIANAQVLVTYDNPQQYSDIGRIGPDSAATLKELEAHLAKLGEKYLAQGRSLRIEVLDIDLAGELRIGAPSAVNNTRLMKTKDSPSIRLRYVLAEAGKDIDRREETVSDRSYLVRQIHQPERLAYEKRMLEEWFRKRFGQDAESYKR